MRQYVCICQWDAVFSLNSADSCVSRRLSSPMRPFTEEFLQEIVVIVLLEKYPCPAFCLMHRSLFWSIAWKKGGTWYFRALLPELMACSPCSPASRKRLAVWLAVAWKWQEWKDEQWAHWGVCVSSVIVCGCHVFESQLILMDTLAHIQIYSPISENFIVFQDTLLDVEEEFISS